MVFKAQHKKTGKRVAIKTANKVEMDSETLSFTRKEIDSLKVMQHPNIVQMFDVFEDDKYFYIVMEFLEGGDMYDYLLGFQFDISEKRARELSI